MGHALYIFLQLLFRQHGSISDIALYVAAHIASCNKHGLNCSTTLHGVLYILYCTVFCCVVLSSTKQRWARTIRRASRGEPGSARRVQIKVPYLYTPFFQGFKIFTHLTGNKAPPDYQHLTCVCGIRT